MEKFSFRRIRPVDIAAAIGKLPHEVRLTEYPDGSYTVEVPDLTATQRVALKSLFTGRGFIEDTEQT